MTSSRAFRRVEGGQRRLNGTPVGRRPKRTNTVNRITVGWETA